MWARIGSTQETRDAPYQCRAGRDQLSAPCGAQLRLRSLLFSQPTTNLLLTCYLLGTSLEGQRHVQHHNDSWFSVSEMPYQCRCEQCLRAAQQATSSSHDFRMNDCFLFQSQRNTANSRSLSSSSQLVLRLVDVLVMVEQVQEVRLLSFEL